jgi:hypothetical protein
MWFYYLPQLPTFKTLSREWFMLHFQSPVAVTKVLKTPWYINFPLVLLKRWSQFLYVSRERVDDLPIWVRLPGLPAELWNEKGFTYLGNAIGSYLDMDMSFIQMGKLSMTRILVLINVRKGLQEDLELTCGDKTFLQKVDYEGISFYCHGCHKPGHNARESAFPMRTKGKTPLLKVTKRGTWSR